MPEEKKANASKKHNVKLIIEYDPDTFQLIRRTYSWKPNYPVMNLEGVETKLIVETIKKQVGIWKVEHSNIQPIVDRVGHSIKKNIQDKKIKTVQKKKEEKQEKKPDIKESTLFGNVDEAKPGISEPTAQTTN